MTIDDKVLLKLLEANGKKPSSKNLEMLKEGLAKKLALIAEEEMPDFDELEKPSQEDMKEIEEIKDMEDYSDLFDIPSEEEKEEVVDKIVEKIDTVDAKKFEKIQEMDVNTVRLMTEESKVKAIKEYRQRNNTSRIVKNFLKEECELEANEIENISEAAETQTVSSVINAFFDIISTKLESIDTTVADRSRGDIASMRELEPIQDAITQLETVLERSSTYIPEARPMIETVIKSMVYLNQYSAVFKDAYRNKKTLLILKYQSIILSIISSVSYLIASIIDFSAGGVDVKKTVVLEKIAPIRTLEQFVQSVASGEFKNINKDITTLREFYCELPVESMIKLVEADDMLNLVVDGIKSFLGELDRGGRVTNSLYKLSGVVILLFSLREIFYTLFRMKTKVSEMVSGIESFANINNGGGQINKLAQFATKLKYDIEGASELSDREIKDDNRKLGTQVRALQASPFTLSTASEKQPTDVSVEKVVNDIDFDW